ncbi:MAG: NAD(P)-dependent oxidoreductase [Chloroflexota bacterium]
MATILITGTSGFIGEALANTMSEDHNIVCLSRGKTNASNATTIQGDFSDPSELKKLDDYHIEVLVHLAAVTGGCTEEDGLRVNVAGTHHLMRYLIDRGCKKFVLASSIATIGFQSVEFRPLAVPIPDEHPCLDRDGYGVSKYLMEEVTRYLARQNPDLDIINIRLASILPEDRTLTPREPGPITEWSLGSISVMYLSDTVRCFTMAAEAPPKPGVRIMNAVGGQANVATSVPDVLRRWYGADADQLDFSYYEQVGQERAPVYDISRIRDELGFVPERPIISD